MKTTKSVRWMLPAALVAVLFGGAGCWPTSGPGGGAPGATTTCSGAPVQDVASYGFLYVNTSTGCGAQQGGMVGPVAVADTFVANDLTEAQQCAETTRAALVSDGYTPMTNVTLYPYQICLRSSAGVTFGVIRARNLSDALRCAASQAQQSGASGHGVCSQDLPCSC